MELSRVILCCLIAVALSLSFWSPLPTAAGEIRRSSALRFEGIFPRPQESPTAAQQTLEATPLECEGCKYLISIVEAWVQKNTTLAEIEKFVDMLCPFTPPEYRAVCADMIHTFAPVVVDIIVTKENPEVVCKMIKFCQ